MMSRIELEERHILCRLGLFETQWIREYPKFKTMYPFDVWYVILKIAVTI